MKTETLAAALRITSRHYESNPKLATMIAASIARLAARAAEVK
jgi:hypothetical protein